MKKQKFQRGDLVHVAKDLGEFMFHFTADVDAIIIGSYMDQFGRECQENEEPNYTIHIKGEGPVSWYYESQLTLIAHNKMRLLKQWKAEEEADYKQKSDLDWIFSHGKEVLKEGYGASIIRIAADAGISENDMWGPHGEGFQFYESARIVLHAAKPFLQKGDKEGWLKTAKKNKKWR